MRYVLAVALLTVGCGNSVITKPTPLPEAKPAPMREPYCVEIIDGIFHEIPCVAAQGPASTSPSGQCFIVSQGRYLEVPCPTAQTHAR